MIIKNSSSIFYYLYSKKCLYSNKICIIGGGLAGLSVGYQLLELVHLSNHNNYNNSNNSNNSLNVNKKYEITIYDSHKVSKGGASSVVGGLLHPLTPKGKLIWNGIEGLNEVEDVIKRLENISNKKIQNKSSFIIRPLNNEKQYNQFKTSSNSIPEFLEMVDSIQYSKLVPHATIPKYGGVIIKNSSIINTPVYLQELWNYIQTSPLVSSSRWIEEPIYSIESIVSQYDLVIVACGSSSHQLWPSLLPYLHLTRGYNLVYPDPGSSNNSLYSPLKYTILSGEYILPHPNKPNYLLCGATKETFSHSNHLELLKNNQKSVYEIKNELHNKLCQIYPPLINIEPIETWSGIRTFISRKFENNDNDNNNNNNINVGSFPVIDQHKQYSHVWLITGYGSRGLIHHQLLAKYLIKTIIENNNNLDNIPLKLRLR